MTNELKDKEYKLHDGTFRVESLVRHDGETYDFKDYVEYSIKLISIGIEKAKEWHDTADGWLITINNKESFKYYTGQGLRKNGKPAKPAFSDVLSSLQSDSKLSQEYFLDFCDDLGYSSDSRESLKIYLECQKTGVKLRKCGIYLTEEMQEFFSEF